MNSAEQSRDRLTIEADPFSAASAGPHLGRPLQTAFREIVRHIVVKTPVVLVTGDAGTGKTLLVDMTARLCAEMGLPVHRIDRGDLVHITLGQQSDVLLIDEANSIQEAMLEAVLPGAGKNTATTTVFLGLPSCTARFMFSNVRPALIELTPFSQADARNYLRDQAAGAGLRDLFADEALELLVVGTHGSPRSLRSMASLAYFFAASGGASQIRVEHVTSALIGRVPARADAIDEALFTSPNRDEVPAEDAIPGEAALPFAAERTAESAGPVLHADESPRMEPRLDEPPATGQGSAQTPEAQKLPDDIWMHRTDAEADAEETEGRRSPLRFRHRTAGAAVTLVLLVVLAVAALTPSIQADTNLAVVPQANTTAAPAIQTPNLAAPILPSDLANETGRSVDAAPVLNEREDAANRQTAGEAESAAKTLPETTEPKTAPRRTLSAEEQAAIDRGIEELQRSARRVETTRR